MKRYKLFNVKTFFFITICFGVIIIAYNYWDNNRVIVKNEKIVIQNLPEEFEGFTFLQISDLHGKKFGSNQDKLLRLINSLNYDCVLFTGDMNKYEISDATSSEAVLDIIKGINNNTLMYWVDGNTGPFACETIDGSYTGELTEIGNKLESMGVNVLLLPEKIEKNGEYIWLVPELCRTELEMQYFSIDEMNEQYKKISMFGKNLEKWYEQLNGNKKIKIRVNHFPLQANLSNGERKDLGYLDYDLSISGHYHGGQIRIPFYGALYIPSPTSGMNGYFPRQEEVEGLNNMDGLQQYVSAGLGASASISFLNFRLFNSPEINLITLSGNK